jgi:hypothetical protein
MRIEGGFAGAHGAGDHLPMLRTMRPIVRAGS